MLIRRAEQAGYVGVTPHQCRHTFSNAWLKSGGYEGDLMRLNGWKSRAMADRYADDVANQRAIEAKRRKGDAIYQPIRPRRWARHDTRARAHVDQRLAGQGWGSCKCRCSRCRPSPCRSKRTICAADGRCAGWVGRTAGNGEIALVGAGDGDRGALSRRFPGGSGAAVGRWAGKGRQPRPASGTLYRKLPALIP
jgi:hypothetical protein